MMMSGGVVVMMGESGAVVAVVETGRFYAVNAAGVAVWQRLLDEIGDAAAGDMSGVESVSAERWAGNEPVIVPILADMAHTMQTAFDPSTPPPWR